MLHGFKSQSITLFKDSFLGNSLKPDQKKNINHPTKGVFSLRVVFIKIEIDKDIHSTTWIHIYRIT